VPRHAVAASVDASSIRVRAPAEIEIGRLVVREDRSRLILEQRDLRRRWAVAVLVRDRDVAEADRRVCGGAILHAASILILCSGVTKTATRSASETAAARRRR